MARPRQDRPATVPPPERVSSICRSSVSRCLTFSPAICYGSEGTLGNTGHVRTRGCTYRRFLYLVLSLSYRAAEHPISITYSIQRLEMLRLVHQDLGGG